jgi:hypothetical protein
MVLDRNLEVAWSHPVTGGRPKGRITAEATRPIPEPIRRASSSVRSIRLKITIEPMSPARPASPAISRPPPGPPENARSARARIGSPSFAKLFQMPDTSSDTELRDREKPHESYIE